MLRVGTDCSGIEAPIQALLQLKIPFKHCFSADIDKYVDWKNTEKDKIPKYAINLIKTQKEKIFIDTGFRHCNFSNADLYIGAITANCRKKWCIPLQRRVNIKELLSLQGFNVNFKQTVNNTQIKKQIGNSMSVNVLKEIIKSLK